MDQLSVLIACDGIQYFDLSHTHIYLMYLAGYVDLSDEGYVMRILFLFAIAVLFYSFYISESSCKGPVYVC